MLNETDQFIQSYKLSDEDIDELIAPTVEEIKGVLGGDWRKTILFLKGTNISGRRVAYMDDDYIKAIMIDKRMVNDPFVRSSVYQQIKNRINEAKVGVLKVHGNYSIISGDPYLLCQSIFGLKKTGLLKAGEIYNKYWVDYGADKLVCFRAPMTCHNNIRLVYPSNSESVRYWYRYMNTCTIFNGWDSTTAALNGADYDGDIVMLTDNDVLLRCHVPTPTLICAQRKAEKCVPDEAAFIKSNIDSFGSEIGQTTNWITSMFEVQAGFNEGSKEYEELNYRIKCGQQAQQDCIDRSKGIICKPMPRSWHDRHEANRITDNEKRSLYRSIVADKKPYFMRYIYPDLMKKYNTYIKNTNRNALREFRMTIQELLSIPQDELTERQAEFLRYYHYRMPVGMNECVMNKICKRFESMFDKYIKRYTASSDFDFGIMKSEYEYTSKQFNSIKKLYEEYNRRLKNFVAFAQYERIDDDEAATTYDLLDLEFTEKCNEVCPNRLALCNIVLDLCYPKSYSKRFAWSMCGSEIIRNLLYSNNGQISYPVKDDTGDVVFCGERYGVETREIEVCK